MICIYKVNIKNFFNLTGENSCMKIELKRWKDRVDALLSSSDNSAEWEAIKIESLKAQEKTQELTDMINDLRKNLTDTNVKYEQANCELETFKTQTALEKSKQQQDLENMRTEKAKREEMFKVLISDLKEVVTTVQKELQLKDVDWGTSLRGPMNEKLKLIKEELANVKRAISEKCKKEKEELLNKSKQLDDLSNELSQSQKKVEETENKLKEKETRIGQLNNFISTTKARLSTQKKSIDDLTKELSDLKASSSASLTSHHQVQQQTQEASDLNHKAELDNLRSKFLQSKFENERLKKELDSTNTALNEANSKIKNSVSDSSITIQSASTSVMVSSQISKTTSPQQHQSKQTPATNANATNLQTASSSLTTTGSTLTGTPVIASTSANPDAQTNQLQQATPTAYITPSRITKVLLNFFNFKSKNNFS